MAADYEVGQKMIKDRSFEQNSDYFSSVFEIGRRHKILNPECMRTDYGKLVHMLMDSQNPDIQRLLEFKLVKKVRTVYDFLKEHDALSLLKHPDVITATTAIVDRGRTRQEVQQAIKVKEAAVKRLIRKFSNDDFGEEEIEWCLYSIGDNSSFLVFNRDPVDQMISYLTKHFPENLEADSARSLAIRFPSTSNCTSLLFTSSESFFSEFLTIMKFSGQVTKEQGSLIRTANSSNTAYRLSHSGERSRMICSSCGAWQRRTCFTATTTTPLETLARVLTGCNLHQP